MWTDDAPIVVAVCVGVTRLARAKGCKEGAEKGSRCKRGGSHDLVIWSCGGFAERWFSQGLLISVSKSPKRYILKPRKGNPGRKVNQYENYHL